MPEYEYNHTPGPWHVESGAVYDARDNLIAYRFSMRHKTKPEGYGDISPVEADRNTHVIAAAPEMLAMLEEMAHTLAEGSPRTYLSTIRTQYLPRIEALTAKARR